MSNSANNKRIAKNTMFLYFRTMVTMIISLYTSRVILQVLGVDDYGIYQAVGGIVGFLSFINAALSQGSSRFITFGLGEGNKEKLRRIFSTTLTGHIILAIVIVCIAESIGYWFFHHKMAIPEERMYAAEWVFHFSIFTVFFTLTQVPYNACIIAHEKMKIFAYVSIVDAVCKLIIVYLLLIGNIDKLILYAILHFVLQVSILIFYRFYCTHNFEESHFNLSIDIKILKDVAGFSSWSLFSNSAIALNNHGILILLNMFFSPAVVAARSISIQVDMAAFHFVSNFQTAAVPQIVKRYATGDYEGSKRLLLDMAKYSFYLMLILALPIFFSADILLKLWLGIVPPYTSIFLKLILIQSLFHVFDTSFYKGLYAKGQLRENALLSPTCLMINFCIVYVFFKMGASPVALSWSTIIAYAFMGLLIKPILLIRIVDYTWGDVFSVILPCIKVTVFSSVLPLIAHFYLWRLSLGEFSYFLIMVVICVLSAVGTIWCLGLSHEVRTKLLSVAKSKIAKK